MPGGIVILKTGKPSVFVHDANLGQDGRAGMPGNTYDQVDAVTFEDSTHRMKQGLQINTFPWTGVFESSTARSYEILKDMSGTGAVDGNARVVTWYGEGTGAASAQGIGYDAARVFGLTENGGPGELLEISGEIVQDGTFDSISLIERGTQTGASFASTWVDLDIGGHLGAPSSTAGGRFYAHVLNNLAVGGNTQWVFTIQHASATGGTVLTATGATATYGSGTTLGTVLISSGLLQRFVRMVGTRDATTGTVDYVVGAVRK